MSAAENYLPDWDLVDTENVTALDVIPVQAMMLWPTSGDLAARRRWSAKKMLQVAKPTYSSLDAAGRQALEGALADNIADLEEDASSRTLHALIKGYDVLAATGYADKRPSLGALHKAIHTGLWRTYKIGEQTINNTSGPVQRFRPVAHLWAAHILWCHLSNQELDRPPFPAERLLEFLAVAEGIRAEAEKARTTRSPTTAMRPGEATMMPARILEALPVCEIDWGSSAV